VIVKRIFKLFTESLDLESFSEQLLLQVVHLFSQVTDLCSLRFHNSELTLKIGNLEFQKADIFKSFLILNFSFAKCGLEDLNLFI